MSCFVEHISTYYPKNYIYCRDGGDLRVKLFSLLLQVPFIPEHNNSDDDEDEHINVESDVQFYEKYEAEEPRRITRHITRGKTFVHIYGEILATL